MVADSSPIPVTGAAASSSQTILSPSTEQQADAADTARVTQNVIPPMGQQRIVIPVRAGQTVELPPSEGTLYAKIGANGNLAIVVDGRTIILSGYLTANEEAPVLIVSTDGRGIDIVDVLAATDPSLDISTAAGPSAGPQGATGSGIYTPFSAGPGLSGLNAEGVLDPTALRYRLIDDERRFHPRAEEEAHGLPSGGNTSAIVDDEGLPGGIPGGKGDVDLGANETFATGTLPGAFGPDGPGSFSFKALHGTQTTLGTETVDLSWDGASHTLTGSTDRGALFTIELNPLTGDYRFELVNNVLHEPGQDENDAIVNLDYTITDGNGDKAKGKITITVDDDSPVADIDSTGEDVVHDETWGKQHDADDKLIRPSAFADFESTNQLHAIGWAVSDGAVVTATNSALGADDDKDATTIAFSLTIPTTGVDSGVDTTDGKSTFMFQEGDMIVGRVGNGDTPDVSGAIAFAVAIDPATGVVSIGQYLSLHHPDGGARYDEAISLTENVLQAVVTVTDSDGDKGTDSVNVGQTIGFQDDGPRASICLTGFDVSHDESKDIHHCADDVRYAPSAFLGFEAANDLHAMGWAVSRGPVVTAWGSWPGADNEGATMAFSLSIKADKVDSGLDTTDNKSIWLFQEGDLIVGRVGDGFHGHIPDADGDIAFAISINPESGVVSLAHYLSLEHPIGGEHIPDESITIANGAIQAVLTVIDGDGDVSKDSVNIGKAISFQDDGPCTCICLTGVEVVHDETRAVQHDANDVAHRPLQFLGFEAFHHLHAIGWAVSPGAVVSAHTMIGADDAGARVIFSLKLPAGFVNSGLDTTDGKDIFLFQEGNMIVGRVGMVPGGDIPNAFGAIAFAVSIDPQTGVVSVGQYLSLEHPIGGSSYDETISLASGAIQAIVTVIDGDGDVAKDGVNIGKTISFQDDGPCASIRLTGWDVTQDESVGIQDNDVWNAPAAFKDFESDHHLNAIGWAVSPKAVVTADVSYGADNEGAKASFSLDIPTTVTNSGVKTTDGQSIWLFEEDGRIVGRVGVEIAAHQFPNPDGAIAFAVSIDPQTGQVGVAQYLSLEHPSGGEHSYDESISLANAAVQVVVTVVDGDGDVAKDTVNIGSAINFEDDGPCASIRLTGWSITHDETVGAQQDANDVSTQPAAFTAFEEVNHLSVPGWAVGSRAIVDADAAFGADNEGASISISLRIPGGVADAGVNTTDGRSIWLFQEGNLIVGRVGNGTDGHIADPQGAIAFAVSIDAYGKVSIGQYLSLEHPDETRYDETIRLADGAIQAVAKVVDGDGDVATDTVNIGGKIAFQDDGPICFDPEDKSLENAAGSEVSGDLDTAGHTGVDGLGAIAFANIVDGQPAMGRIDGHLVNLTSGGQQIYLYTSDDDTVLTGRQGSGDGAVVFTLTLNGANDSYILNLVKPIDSGSGIVFNDFGNAGAGYNYWVGVFTDGNQPHKGGDPNSEDLLLTPIGSSFINTSSFDIGVGKDQHIDPGEGVRIDFVQDVDGDQHDYGGFEFKDHFLVTDASFAVTQIEGKHPDAVVRVSAYNADDDTQMTGDNGDVPVALLLSGLAVRDDDGNVVPIGTGGIDAFQDGGSIIVDGLREGYTVEVKSSTPFDRLEITNADGFDPDGKGCIDALDGESFEIGAISVISTGAGSDIKLEYDTKLTDGDNDSIQSSEGIDLALLASSTPIRTAVSDEDVVAGTQSLDGDHGSDAAVAGQVADLDAGTSMAYTADNLSDLDAPQISADDDAGNPITNGADVTSHDLWAAIQLNYDAIANDSGDNSDALNVTSDAGAAIPAIEVLDGAADGVDGADANDGIAGLGDADASDPPDVLGGADLAQLSASTGVDVSDLDSSPADAGQTDQASAGGTSDGAADAMEPAITGTNDAATVPDAVDNGGLGELTPYFGVPAIDDQISNEDVPVVI
jgi:hypothetical protein